MSETLNYDFIIIGGGASGLAMGALLAKKKLNYKILESHYYLGGSSSYFIRNGYSFDIGATTLSGLNNNGPLTRFLNETNIELPLKKIDPGLISVMGDISIKRYNNNVQYQEELIKHFPFLTADQILIFLKELSLIEKTLYDLINKNNLPAYNFTDFINLVNLNNISGIQLIPKLFKNTEEYLKTIFTLDEKLVQYFNEILFITAQNKMKDVPALLGAMGLNYPSDTYYCMGGMKNFIDLIAQPSLSNIVKNQKVIQIKKAKNGHMVITLKGDKYFTPNLISTMPFWNHEEICIDYDIKNYFSNNVKMKNAINTSWSAFTLYFTIPKHPNLESLYFQIHGKIHEKIGSESFFTSFSHPDDDHRNHNNRQTVTISTHCKFDVFNNLNDEEYQKLKIEIATKIQDTFCDYFRVSKDDIKHLEIGTPLTFKRFTNRFNGLVGGIGFSLENSPLKSVYSPLPDKNFYLLGDTSFMGQGIATVIAGALSLNKKI